MRISTIQLKLLLPIVHREARDNPSPEWDALLERMLRCASHRGVKGLKLDLPPKDVEVPKQHPLLGG